MTYQTAEMGKPIKTQDILDAMTDSELVRLQEELLESLAFKGTIHQIRELVNDPKWDDKV